MKKMISFEANGMHYEVLGYGFKFPETQVYPDGSCSIYASGVAEELMVHDAGYDPLECYKATHDVALYLEGKLSKYYGEVKNLKVCKDLQILRHRMKTSTIKWTFDYYGDEKFRMIPVGVR